MGNYPKPHIPIVDRGFLFVRVQGGSDHVSVRDEEESTPPGWLNYAKAAGGKSVEWDV